MDMITIGSIIGGLVFGLIIAYVNVLITKKFVKQTSVIGVMSGNSARFILDVAALAIGYFVCKVTSLPYIPVLVSIAVGLSIGGLLFLRMLVNNMKRENDQQGESSESENI